MLNINFQEIEDFQINTFFITKKELSKLETRDCEVLKGK